jgi:hypothetical protein
MSVYTMGPSGQDGTGRGRRRGMGGRRRGMGGRGSVRQELWRLLAGPSRGERVMGGRRSVRQVRFPLALALVLLSVVFGVMAPAAAPPRAEAAPIPVSGKTKWAIILCKFQDKQNNPADLQPPPSFFEDLFTEKGAGKGGMFDYWRDMSYGAVDVTGSTVHGWYVMPYTLGDHLQLGGANPGGRPQKLQACIDAAAQDPNFPAAAIASSYYGIVAIWNDAQDTWGGRGNYTVNGTQKTFGIAAFNPWGWDPAIVAQEMGHGYGLDHSRATDPDPSKDYQDPWDPMSAWTFGGQAQPTFPNLNFVVSGPGHFNPQTGSNSTTGASGPSLNAGYRDLLGWIPSGRVWTYGGSPSVVTLAGVNNPGVGWPLMAKIPLGASRFYTVHLRLKEGWDAGIQRDAVLIHEVRPDGRTYIVKTVNLDRSLQPGQSFTDPANNLKIYVDRIEKANKTATVLIGPVPPVSSAAVSPKPTAGGWTSGATVTLSASSGPSGQPVQTIYYSAAPGSAQAVGFSGTAGATGSVAITAEGQTTLVYYAVDVAGVYEYPANRLTVKVDKTPPTTTYATMSVAGGVQVTLSASDGGAGVKQIQYQINATPAQTVPGNSAQFNVSSPGPTDVFFWATDEVGNVERQKGFRLEAKLQVSPTSLSFGSQVFGTTSAPQTVTLKNSGNLNLTIKSYGTSDPQFGTTTAGVAMPCGTPPITLAPNAFCNVGVTFSPTGPYAAGPRTAVLGISHDGNNGTSRAGETAVPLDGVAQGVPAARLSPTTLAFAKQRVGATGTQGLYITNDGTDTLSISAMSIGGTNAGDFAISTTPPAAPLVACGTLPARLPAGQSCVIVVAFTPSATGQRSATLTITHNANNVPGSQSAVSLSGQGVEPAITLSPSGLNFGTLNLGAISAPQQVTLTAGGSMELMIYGFGISGANAADFWIEGDVRCSPRPAVLTPGYSLDPGTTCTFSLVFRPGAAGARSAALEIATNATPGVHTVALSGSGASSPPPPAPAVSLSPLKWDFGQQPAGTMSDPVEVMLTNSGGAKLQIKGVWVSGKFAAEFPILKENCSGTALAPGTACVVYVAFAPSDADLRQALLEFYDDAADSPQQVELTGFGAVYMPWTLRTW